MTTRTVLGVLAPTIVMALGVCRAAARRRWNGKIRDIATKLANSGAGRMDPYSEREIETLPTPVQRYFRAVLANGQPVITHARVASRGTFNMGKAPANAWKPFTATQDFYPAAPGFVWNARVRMAPGVDAFVRDALVDGEGSMAASALGIVTIVDAHGSPELATGALMRYLAEAPWLPTALLPRGGVRWTPVSPSVAKATMTVGQITASLDFRFGADGLIVGCEGLRDNTERNARLPWVGVYRHWMEKAGMKIPSEGEVSWQLPTGPFPYWRGAVEPRYDLYDERERGWP